MATVIPQNTATNVIPSAQPKWNYGTADAPVTVQAPSNDPMLTKHVINQANSLGFNASTS